MGSFIAVPGVNPPTDRPKVDLVDPIAPSAGGLYLYEFGNPLSDFPAGVPSNGQSVKNLLRDQASALTGGSLAAMDSALNVSAYSAGALLERTAKGGIHSAHSQTVAVSGGIYLPVPLAILNYIAANPTHSYYQSIWGRLTRPGNSTASWATIQLVTPAAATNLLFSVGNDGTNYPNGATRIGYRRLPAGGWRPAAAPSLVPGPMFANTGVSQYTGTPDATRSGKAIGERAGNPYAGSSAAADQTSAVLYRSYLEDLTVSGRTYSQVDTIDYNLFQEQVVAASGGRYSGDTFTSPTTLT